MAYSFSTGNTPLTGPIAIYLLISTLVTAGWVVKSDSDGTTYASAGGQVTGGGSGSHGLGNNLAWIRLQAPAVSGNTRELTIQRSTNGVSATGDLAWRIKYSANAKFTGGSPSATVTPSATDEVFMVGGGTDASPTFLASWFAANNTYRWHIVCGGANELYSFVAFALTTGTSTALNAIFLDVMKAGSYPSIDVDPAVMYCSSVAGSSVAISEVMTAGFLITTVTNPAKARAWLGPTSSIGQAVTGSSNVTVSMSTLGSSTTKFGAGQNLAVNPFTGGDDLISAFWGRSTAQSTPPAGMKGFSTLFCMGSMGRTNMDTHNSNGTKNRVYYGTCWLPWDGSTPTL